MAFVIEFFWVKLELEFEVSYGNHIHFQEKYLQEAKEIEDSQFSVSQRETTGKGNIVENASDIKVKTVAFKLGHSRKDPHSLFICC